MRCLLQATRSDGSSNRMKSQARCVGCAATAPAQAVTAKVAATPDECLQSAADLVLNAEEKKLADDKIDRIEELLLKMEAHCEGRRFPEALVVATDIKSLIEKQ